MEDIQQSITTWLSSISDNATEKDKIGSRYDTWWLEEIRYWLIRDGKMRNLEVVSRLHKGLDICWIKKTNGIMERKPIALVCDWRSSPHLENRFDSLVWTRADLRVMVFDATYPKQERGASLTWAKERIDYLMNRARQFNQSEPSDEYLFCVWCRDKEDASWHFQTAKV